MKGRGPRRAILEQYGNTKVIVKDKHNLTLGDKCCFINAVKTSCENILIGMTSRNLFKGSQMCSTAQL